MYSRISLWATLSFLFLLTLLHILKPEIDPSWRFISELALGEYGYLMTLSFFLLAISHIALFMVLKHVVKAKIGLALLLISAAGLILAGIFETDPISAEVHTTSGTIHNIGGTLGMAMPLSALLIGIAFMRDPQWKPAKRRILWFMVLALFGFLVSFISLAAMISQSNGKFGPDVLVGWPTRFELVAYCAWLLVVSKTVAGGKGAAIQRSNAFNTSPL